MFVDEAVIRLRAGHGGDGCVSFHRAKFVPRGGPDGGDGGGGGGIYFEADHNLTTLYDFSIHPILTAKDGTNGGSNKKFGRAGQDLTVRIPVGTQIFLEDDRPAGAEMLIADVVDAGQKILAAAGGRGGGGNARFASAKYRLPHFALKGAPGRNIKVRLSLKILSDLAIVGLPNSGKSTLLSALTAARPKIADYPFTTLTPNLGVLKSPLASIVLADIPGLVKDAHAGRGLGNRFLKHIDRARALLILLDAERNPAEDFALLRDEIVQFKEDIWERPRIVAVNKIDLIKRAPMKRWAKVLKEEAAGVSAKTGEGIEKLLKRIETLWEKTPTSEAPEPTTLFLEKGATSITRLAAGFRIESGSLEELASMIPRNNREAVQWFVGRLKADGVFRQLEKSGCQAGDLVHIGPMEIAYE